MDQKHHYLTRVRINDSRRSWWSVYNKLEPLHALVEKSVPTDYGRLLWRVDNEYEGPSLYVLSDTIPDMTAVVESYGWPRLDYSDQVKTVDMSRFFEDLREGQRYGFRVTVNPSRRSSSSGKRYSLVGRGAKEWTRSKLEDSGFSVLELEQKEERHASLSKNGRRAMEKLTTYDGVLIIRDPVLAAKALVSGIGRLKAYGAGLITLSRV